jgi:tetratricopeptide (TPR) repeat protein
MSGMRSDHYRSYMKHYARERFEEALAAIEGAIQSVPTDTPGDRLEKGALVLQRGVVLHRMNRPQEAVVVFSEAERLLDAVTFSAHMAPFYARHGNDPKEALLHSRRVLELLREREQHTPLDDGERYYRRAAIEIQTSGGRL